MSDPILLPYQARWIADPSRVKICEKGRRTGITWAEAADDVLIAAASREAGGQNVYYFPQAHDDAIEYIEACGRWARAFGTVLGEWEQGTWQQESGLVFERDDPDRSIQTFSVRFASGHRIVALSSAPARARGKQGVFVLDEAAFHPDLPGVLKAVMATVLRGGRVRVISTHLGVENAFNEVIQQIRAGKRKGTVHRVTFREAVTDGMYRRICELAGTPWTPEQEQAWVADAYAFYGDDAAEELDVIPSQSGGAYLSIALIEARMSRDTPLVRGSWPMEFGHLPDRLRQAEIEAWCNEQLRPHLEALNPELPHVLGEDFGRLADLTTLDIGATAHDLVRRVCLHVELARCPFQQQEQIVAYIIDRLPHFRRGALDATGNGLYLAERMQQRYGASRIEAVKLSDAWYLEHLPPFKAALQDATLEGIPTDLEIRDDLRAIQVIDGVPKLPKSRTQAAAPGKQQRHGDAAISLVMLHYASQSEAGPIEWTPAPMRKAFDLPPSTSGAGWHDRPPREDDFLIPRKGAW